MKKIIKLACATMLLCCGFSGKNAIDVYVNPKSVGKLNARLSIRDITRELRLRNLDIEDILVNIIEYEGEDMM